VTKLFFRAYAGTFILILAIASSAFAQTEPKSFPNVNIINFGQMDERYYRGAQPVKGDYQALKDLGVNTVIDLRNDPTDYEKTEVETLGMKYINLPMSGWKSPKESEIAQFMTIMNDPATGTVYVHCKAGKHRTGITGAVYRHQKYGWDYTTAYKEMKNYNFKSWPVHYALKGYIQDYFENVEKEQKQIAKTAEKAAAANQEAGAIGN
jgi:tyrosine-protein phosphatase SIW14